MENAMPWKTLDDMDLAGKTVLVRVDINVPMEAGRVTDMTRIDKITRGEPPMTPDRMISVKVAADVA